MASKLEAKARALHAMACKLEAKARALRAKSGFLSADAVGVPRETLMKVVKFSIVLLTAIFAGLQAFAALGWL